MSGRILQLSPSPQSSAFSVAECLENVSYCAHQRCGRHPSSQLAARQPYPRMELTQESFDLLLFWLHPVPDEAGKIYLKIRAGLVRNFAAHGCSVPDELADITFDRVAQKLPTIIDTYVGEREPYIHRVAFYVLREYRAKLVEIVELDPDQKGTEPDEDDDKELRSFCVNKCMRLLPAWKKNLIEKYYHGSKGTKIRNRKELAASLNIELAALRVKALRIRQALKKCAKNCLANPEAMEQSSNESNE